MRFINISKYLLILITPFLLFLLVLNFIGFDKAFFQEKFSEYQVEDNVPEASLLHKKVIDFIRGDSDQLPSEFNQREKQHLWDVRNTVMMLAAVLYLFIA